MIRIFTRPDTLILTHEDRADVRLERMRVQRLEEMARKLARSRAGRGW